MVSWMLLPVIHRTWKVGIFTLTLFLSLIPPLFAQSSSGCSSISDVSLVVQEPLLSKPGLLLNFQDPQFGGCLKRISDAASQLGGDQAVPLYSQLQAWNADQSKILLEPNFIIDAQDYSHFHTTPFLGSKRWSPNEPDIIYYITGNSFAKYNINSGNSTILRTFSEYSRLTQEEAQEEMSADGRYVVLEGRLSNGELEIFIYDLVTNTKSPVIDGNPTGGQCGGGDWFAMSPSGKYAIVNWGGGGDSFYCGMNAYDLNMNFIGKVATGHGHGDLAIDENGNEWYVEFSPDNYVGITGGQNGLAIIKKNRIPDGYTAFKAGDQNSIVVLTEIPWFHNMHISCQGHGSGFCVSSTYSPEREHQEPFEQEIFIVHLDSTEATPHVERIAHHRSDPFYIKSQPSTTCPLSSYWAQPHATLRRDGSQILFGSSWGQNCTVDAYLIDLSNPQEPPPPPPLTNFSLSISKPGNGQGTVTSSNTGISCGTDCAQIYAENTIVTLAASASVGSTFDGWNGGGCSGTGSCSVTMTGDTLINANFSQTGSNPPPTTGSGVNPAFTSFPTNTWIKLTPKIFDANGIDLTTNDLPYNAYSGMVYAKDIHQLIMFGGGGHGGRWGNDVWLYDTAKNEWHQQYFPDPQSAYPNMTFNTYCNSTDPLVCNPNSEWLPRGMTTNGRPWTSHSYDQMAWDAHNKKFIFYGPNFNFGKEIINYFNTPDAFAYDVPSKTWESLTSSPSLYGQTNFAEYDPDDKVIVAGRRGWGKPGSGTSTGTGMWVLDVVTGTWQQQASSPPHSFLDTNMVYDSINKVMLLYGGDYEGCGSCAGNELWSYNHRTDTWTKKNPTPDPVFGVPPAGAPQAAFDNLHGILLIRGQGDTGSFIPTWSYNVKTNSWKKMNPPSGEPPNMQDVGSNLSYDPVNNIFYLVVQKDPNKQASEFWAYRYEPTSGTQPVDTVPPNPPNNLKVQ